MLSSFFFHLILRVSLLTAFYAYTCLSLSLCLKACMALCDLLMGRKFSEVQPFLEDLWKMSFRALDDVKDSTRKAASYLSKTLVKMAERFVSPLYFLLFYYHCCWCCHCCSILVHSSIFWFPCSVQSDPAYTSATDGPQALAIILPILLHTGITAPAREVRYRIQCFFFYFYFACCCFFELLLRKTMNTISLVICFSLVFFFLVLDSFVF